MFRQKQMVKSKTKESCNKANIRILFYINFLLTKILNLGKVKIKINISGFELNFH